MAFKELPVIIYTAQDLNGNEEKELELKLFRWNNIKDKYLPKLKANGILRMVTTKVWNKECNSDNGLRNKATIG